MILSKENLKNIHSAKLIKPNESIFNLPEKVLQFGTGVLLRGLPDYFIDKANRQGIFNGRVAVVKSTGTNTSDFDQQDSLYTLCIRGIADGREVKENIVSSAISRVIAADKDWESILAIAASKDLQIIVSNTTEVGIQLVEEDIYQNPPLSFPAKVLAVLYHRYLQLGESNSGLVIIATELIPENGKKLESIVLALAQYHSLSDEFIHWLTTANTFCNSLVDRIVPGKPDAVMLAEIEEELGYHDQLLAMAEPYTLWAIEGNSQVKEVLSFASVDEGVIIAEDIEIYRELKVRLLNGTHTLTSGIAFLSQVETVKDAMKNELLSAYVANLMADEIGPAIPYKIEEVQTIAFANAVKDRFANPYIEHLWLNITFQYSMKMRIRILPVLLNYYKIYHAVPKHIALGFAAYLTFMKVVKHQDGKYYGLYQQNEYLITDDNASYFYQNQAAAISTILEDQEFWGVALNALPGFIDEVIKYYNAIAQDGVEYTLSSFLSIISN
jgi:tagaturonate reductase